jgi:serpin B
LLTWLLAESYRPDNQQISGDAMRILLLEVSARSLAMGMVDAFILGKADFTGMTRETDFFISAVLHKAYVDVKEEGTEAGAATVVTLAPGPSERFTFRADHPFLFLIQENRTGSILFIGRVMDPTKSS